eukprot:TRINITY_DN8006_c0_g2_i11.p1 TRINITY_DN8006_c0_g2~~TRINITY_DN8006_c0_g2_i11.p1  ORF type:complete len:159 (+),score=67.91 TRINITY_DN8006_c0_g2_i11:428-904(+)
MSLTLKPEYRKFQEEVVKQMVKNSIEMAQNPYGNYVVQLVLENYSRESVVGVIEALRGRVPQLSSTKFSSNVIEKCMEKADEKLRNEIIREITNADSLIGLMKNKFGNFVIQRALGLSAGEVREELVARLQQNIPLLSSKKMKASWIKVMEDLKKGEV